MRSYDFCKFPGIQPATREALNWLFENGGLPVIKGEWFFVDPANGAATSSGSAESPVDSIETAYALCTSGSGDGILLLSGGTTSADTTSYIDKKITWSKHGITVMGAAAPVRMSGRARVSNKTRTTGALDTIAFPEATTITDSASGFLSAGFEVGQTINIDTTDATNDGQAIITGVTADTITCAASSFTIQTAGVAGSTVVTTYVTELIEVSGDNNAFYNVDFGHFGANALELAAVKVSGKRNYFGRCHFLGLGDETPAAVAMGCDLFLNGAEECTFEGCTLGANTTIRAAANANVKYGGLAKNNQFSECTFLSYSETAGHGCINSIDATSMMGVDYFAGCRFINWQPNGYGDLTAMQIGTTPTSGHFLFDGCTFFGYTAVGTTGAVYVANSAAVASGAGGIATTI